jgi:hypothetical protein
LSNTKSSEIALPRQRSSSDREYARYPVWYSDKCAPSITFSNSVSSRLARNFQSGMPPRSAPLPRMREPSTMS